MYALIGLKAAYIIFYMFVGMIRETSKDKKWSIGSNESAAGKVFLNHTNLVLKVLELYSR